jgi:hypothetical protein
VKKYATIIVAIIQLLYVGKLAAQNINEPQINDAQVLIIYNQNEKDYSVSLELIIEYFNHFGINYFTKDINDTNLISPDKYNLILISGENIFTNCATTTKLEFGKYLTQCIERGVGIVSFTSELFGENTALRSLTQVNRLSFTNVNHYITQNHEINEEIKLDSTFVDYLPFGQTENDLIKANGANLLSVDKIGNGKIAYWSTTSWMNNNFLGQIRGLDDCFLRSLIWCAKKPFFVRGLLPIVTMRVDDVYGTGARWNKTPFWWVKIANKYHFQPWLGLFLDNVDQAGSIDELRELIMRNACTANPHAFTRPKFIYFDHPNYKVFDSIQSIKNMKLVDAWYEKNAPLPKSTFLVPHFYELGHVCADYAVKNWGIKYFALLMGVDSSWYTNSNVIYQLPYKNYMKPFHSSENKTFSFSDYVRAGDSELFSCLTEIRDLGYDWAPQNNVNAAFVKGRNILKRGLESMVISCLMTHETDFLYAVSPENWESMLKQITESISSYKPIYLTMDSAMAILKSTVESHIKNFEFDGSTYRIQFEGNTTTPTSLYVYTEESKKIVQNMVFIPSFNGSYKYELLKDSISTIITSATAGKPKYQSKSNVPESIISDPFLYNNKFPLSQIPVQTDEFSNSSELFTTKASDQENWIKLSLNIPEGYFLKAIDVWGKNDILYDSNSSNDLIFTLNDGVFSYASSSIDLDTINDRTVCYRRINFEDINFPYYFLAKATSLRIDHSRGNNNELTIAEIRPIIEKLDTKIILDSNDFSVLDDIEIIPNPIRNSFTVYQNVINDESELTIYTEMGEKVYSRKIYGATLIDGNIFPSPGVYFVSVKGKIKSSFKKIIKV